MIVSPAYVYLNEKVYQLQLPGSPVPNQQLCLLAEKTRLGKQHGHVILGDLCKEREIISSCVVHQHRGVWRTRVSFAGRELQQMYTIQSSVNG